MSDFEFVLTRFGARTYYSRRCERMTLLHAGERVVLAVDCAWDAALSDRGSVRFRNFCQRSLVRRSSCFSGVGAVESGGAMGGRSGIGQLPVAGRNGRRTLQGSGNESGRGCLGTWRRGGKCPNVFEARRRRELGPAFAEKTRRWDHGWGVSSTIKIVDGCSYILATINKDPGM